MMPLLHFSAGSICLVPRFTFKNTKKEIHLNKCNSKRGPLLFLQPTFPLSWISSHGISKTRILTSAVEADVAVEADPNPNTETSEEAEPISEETEEATSTLPDAKVKGVRKNVKKEDLIPGAKFTGIVRSMQPFGIFVDIGSFTDGLVHISQISSDYIKDVKALFTVGQEVEVWLLVYDMQAGRISLTMRDPGDEKEGSSESGKGGPGAGTGRGWSKRRPRYVEGESYLGTIKEITEEGALVTLPGDGEGFLPVSEQVAVEGSEVGTTLEVGEDIMVRVLSVDQDDMQLTMKEEEYMDRELLDILDKKKEEEEFSEALGKGYEVLEEGMEYDEEEAEEGGDDTEEVVEQAIVEDSTVNVDSGTMFVNPFVFTFLRSRYAANAGKRLELIGAEKKTGSVIAANPALISGVADGEVAVSDDGSEIGSASITQEPLDVAELEGGEVATVGAVSGTEFAPVEEEPVATSDPVESEVTAVGAVSETASVSVSEEPVEVSTAEEVGAVTIETVSEVGESGSITEDSASVVEEAVAASELEVSEVVAAEEPVAISKEEKGEVTAAEAVSEVAESQAVSESTSEIAGRDKTKEEADQKTEVSDTTPEASPNQTHEVKGKDIFYSLFS
jgi:elongation factor Ts